jgi:hypothetical protein
VAADEPAREDAVGRHANPERAARGQDRVLDSAGDQRVLDLEIGDRMDGVRAA